MIKLSLSVALVAALAGSAAAVPSTMSFTARLTDNGQPVEGNVALEVEIYDLAEGGVLLWEETHPVVVAERGLVFANLGSIDPVNNGLDGQVFDGATVYAQLIVDGDTLSPRIPLTSVPYAVRAGIATELDGFDPGTVQTRVTGVCTAGSFVTGVNANGTVNCVADSVGSGDITGVTGTGGITGGGAAGAITLGIDTAVIQRRVTGTCTAGNFVTGVNADGTVVCVADAVGSGDITGVTVGGGITGGGTSGAITLGINTAVIQSRVTGTCTAGNYVTGVNANGTVACAADAIGGTGDITGVAPVAGGGLAGGGTTGDVTLSIAAGGVGTTQLADNAVTTAKIAAGAVNTADIANGAVTMSKTTAPAAQAAQLMPNGSFFVYPSTATTSETAGSCLVTASALFLGTTNTPGFRVRPTISNAANASFPGLHWGYSYATNVAPVSEFPNGTSGREATSTGLLNVTGAGPWRVGCEIQGNQNSITCRVSYLCN